ncbi:response regulator transcription factor [Cohnella pontilimi]|uniref:Response regulator transcription factor n=1 Tax=Cohnella pontilimi TaxID=2564100 RepID=A0A4V5LSD1_9BACL|nr:response regulator transcription factor [Cohnella pontilimi]TJY42609.1 response regulator transcription factor [Cohnella pontilimi]
MINILLVDDHPSVMEGTKLLLEQEEDMKVVIEQSASKALDILNDSVFDVMLFDLTMPEMSGIELAKKVLAKIPEATILIYSGNDLKDHFNTLIDAGISGIVSKTANKEQLVTSVRCALRGEAILPLDLVKQLRRLTRPEANRTELETKAVSAKEQQILKEIAKGKSNKEIATDLHMSQRSLEYGLTNLFHKLNVKSRLEAAIKAKELKLLDDVDFALDIL